MKTLQRSDDIKEDLAFVLENVGNVLEKLTSHQLKSVTLILQVLQKMRSEIESLNKELRELRNEKRSK